MWTQASFNSASEKAFVILSHFTTNAEEDSCMQLPSD
jgi:hypothetical protein